MKILKKSLFVLLSIIILAVATLYLTGYGYIIKGVKVVYLTGHTTAYIDDSAHFDTRVIENGTPQAWKTHAAYNSIPPTKALADMHRDMETVAFLIVKNDSIFHEYYADGYSENSLTNSFSMAKSITVALLFKAIQDGYIKGLDAKVHEFFPEIGGAYAEELTVGDLASMASGTNWNENYVSPFSMTAEAYYDSDIKDLILGLKVEDKPGTAFEYQSGDTQLLGLLLAKATGKTNTQYFSESFWKPMGMHTNATWQLDSAESGTEKTYCCIASNARDFGRFGMLWQHQGQWNGQQLIRKEYATLAQRPRFKENTNYGYGLWLSNYMGKNISYMRGILGQYVICIPEDNVMIVRLGHKRKKPNADGDAADDFKVYIAEAYEMLSKI